MAIRELTPGQEAGVELAVQLLTTTSPYHNLPASLSNLERAEAMRTVHAIGQAVRAYPHVILELTEHA